MIEDMNMWDVVADTNGCGSSGSGWMKSASYFLIVIGIVGAATGLAKLYYDEYSSGVSSSSESTEV